MTRVLLTKAQIRTMNQAQPTADALVIEDGRILAIGDAAPMAALAGPEADVIDAQGHLVLPGFQDAHIHLLNGGTDLVETAQLYDCTTTDQIAATLQAHAATQDGPMIWGAGWQCGFFGDATLTRAVLDPVTPDRPCLIYDGNFHNLSLIHI